LSTTLPRLRTSSHPLAATADDAELAFLEAQKDEYDPSSAYNMKDAPSGQDEYDPAATYSPHSYQSASTQPDSAANSPPAADTEGENGLQPQPTQTSAEGSAAPPSKRPRTVGGFVDESEDEEEEPAVQPQEENATLSATGASETPQPSFTNSPNNFFRFFYLPPKQSIKMAGNCGCSTSSAPCNCTSCSCTSCARS